MDEMIKVIEDNLPQVFNMEPIKEDDQVIQDAGALPENSEDGFDDEKLDKHAGPGKLSMPASYFKGTKSFKVPNHMKRSEESDA